MRELSLIEIVSLQLRCYSERASARFDTLVNERGHIWSHGNEPERVCGLLYQLVDPKDSENRLCLVPTTAISILADEIVEYVVPVVFRKLERL